jgi:hypothetical protein
MGACYGGQAGVSLISKYSRPFMVRKIDVSQALVGLLPI